MYLTILFDLDGTITNSEEGIIRSVEMRWKSAGFMNMSGRRCCGLSARRCASLFRSISG